ncbi:MAG: BON domain-containing protein, partial [Hyphomicrobiales bacterium]|nr:BON domain-containing protein [Hyphomicrobiales bacterium]
VSQGLSALGTLETGHLGISDEFVHLEGWVKPVNLAALNEVTDKRPDWRRGVSVLLEEISPYRVFAHLSNDGVVVLSGFAPGESERDAIIDIASDVFGADHVMSELALAAGKPSGDWSGATACALSALGLLREGSVELIDSNVSLIGTAADQDAVDEVGIIASGVPSGFSWSDKLDILQPRISPFTLDLVKRETFWEIAGYAPDEVTRERLKAALSIDDYETQLSGDLTIADGMPSAAWSDLVLHGIGALRELETGRLNVSDETVELEGAVKLDNLTAFRAAAGDRVDWESKVTLLLNEVAPYRLSAVKSSNGGVSVSGYAPGEASRESVVHIASEIFGRDQVETQLELAAGVPTGDWTGAVNSALSGLALLDEGSVELVDADAFLTGIAPDQSAVTQIVVAASNMPQGFTLSDELTVALPRISPFTFNVTKGASVWEVSGYAPDETTRDRLFSKIRNSAGGIAVTGDIALAEGMPVETWPDLVSQGVNALNSLETGSLAVSDESVRLDGQVKPENLAVLRAATSDRHVWQNGVSLLLDDVSPYRLSALKSADGSVVLSGFAPGEIEKDEVIGLASDVFGADRIDSELALAAGAPSGDWSGAMAYSFAGLALLNEGYVELLDRAVKLSGVAADQSVVDEVASAALHLPAGFSWSDDLQVLRPLISPFTLNVTKAGEGWSVSGYAPDEATRELLMSTIRSAAGNAPFTGELYLADGMPSETWPDLVVNGIGTLGKLEAATLKVSDETVQLEGLAKISAVAPRKTEKFTTDAPKPASLYESRPTEVDDLKQVKGIGPVMERILNEHGCYHFKQLANFSEQDIEWVSATIDTFPDRITRDRWVEQAQELYYEKYGENCDADMRSQSA